MNFGKPFLPDRSPAWSADCFSDPLEYAVITNDIKAIGIISNAPNYGWASRPVNDIAERTGTGSVGHNTYTHRVGKVGVARGGKEGDSAFIQEGSLGDWETWAHEPALLAAARSSEVNDTTLDFLIADPNTPVSSSALIGAAI